MYGGSADDRAACAAGLVDLNAAPASLIAAGLTALGVSRTDALEIAESWEPRGASDVTRYPHMDVKVTGDGIKYWLHRDHLASVRMVTDASGAVVEQSRYAAYGERLGGGGQTSKGFIGERHDPESGLVHPLPATWTRSTVASSRPTTGIRRCPASAPIATPMPRTTRSIRRIGTGMTMHLLNYQP